MFNHLSGINVSISGNRLSNSVQCKPTHILITLFISRSTPLFQNLISLDFAVYVVMILTFQEKYMKCATYLKTRRYPDFIVDNSRHRAKLALQSSSYMIVLPVLVSCKRDKNISNFVFRIISAAWKVQIFGLSNNHLGHQCNTLKQYVPSCSA